MAQRVPVVLLDRLSTPDVDQVGVETVEPMKLLVRHLIELGHRRIGLVAADESVLTIRERHAGYTAAMGDAGLPETLEVVVADIDMIVTEARKAVHHSLPCRSGQRPWWRPVSRSLSAPSRLSPTCDSPSPRMSPWSSLMTSPMPICLLLALRVLHNRMSKSGVKLRASSCDVCASPRPRSGPSD